MLEFGGTLSLQRHAIRRGFRGEKFVATFKFYWNNSATIGFVPRWVGPAERRRRPRASHFGQVLNTPLRSAAELIRSPRGDRRFWSRAS